MGKSEKNKDDILIPPEIVSAFKLKDTGYNLLLKGRAGVGKTTFAMSLLSFLRNLLLFI